MGRFARGKGARSYEARFSPSRSPFPGTSLFCAVVWGSVLVNACMLLYWWRQAEPIFLFRRTEGGLRSRPVPGGCCIAGANLLLPVVLLLALISAPACCIAGADLLLPVVLLPALTCSCLSLYCRRSLAPVCCRITGIDLLLPVAILPCSLAPVCCRITGIDLLLPVAVLPALTCSRLLSHHWHKPAPINNREQARCAGRFPVRRNKNRLSLTLPIQQHTGLSR